MKVLVTGASGYLGRYVMRALGARGVIADATTRRDCDLTDDNATACMFKGFEYDAVIHCAAVVPKDGDYHDQPAASASLRMAQNVFRSALPVVYASSMTAAQPTTAYARAKAAAEQLLLARGVKGDIAVRLPGLYGRPRDWGVLYGSVRAALAGDSLPVGWSQDTAWAAMPVSEAAEEMVNALYWQGHAAICEPSSPAIARNLSAAVACIADYCGVPRHQPPYPAPEQPVSGMCRRRLEQFVEDVRQDLQRARTA